MNKSFSWLLISAFIFLTIVSCKKKDEVSPSSNPSSNSNSQSPTGPAPDFLKEGTKYVYIYKDFFGTDTIKTVVEKQLAKDTFMVRNMSDVSYVAPTQYYVLKDHVLYSSFRLRDPDSYQILCKFGQPVGTSWQVMDDGTPYTYSIDALNQTIATGYGTVTDAVKVKIVESGTGTVSYNYFSPSVGVIGTGAYGSDASMQLYSYTAGTSGSTPPDNYLPTFGSFPFLTVGKFWRYAEEDFGGNQDTIKVEIVSKLSGHDIYKVKLLYESDNSVDYEYWFEDHGMLMVYEEGETYQKADPIYMKEADAQVGYGWVGRTLAGTTFFYKITDLNYDMDTYYGNLNCMAISVSSGLFSSQTNYWNENKGNVYVGGLVYLDVVSSNARSGAVRIPHLPGFTF